LAYVPIQDLLKTTDESVYKLVVLASKRALELGAGSEKLVEAAPNTKLTSIALKEIIENKVNCKEAKK